MRREISGLRPPSWASPTPIARCWCRCCIVASGSGRWRLAIEDIELEIGNLRGIISDLRPALLDDLGLVPAIEALLDRRRDAGLDVSSEISLPDASDRRAALAPELDTTVYRLVQESLTNVVKHAQATTVHVRVCLENGRLVIEVTDDGRGFDPEARTAGFGLAGMRERVYLAG